jgi:hypothetical protein
MLMDLMTRENIPHLNTKKIYGKENKVFRITLLNLGKEELVSDTENVMHRGHTATTLMEFPRKTHNIRLS